MRDLEKNLAEFTVRKKVEKERTLYFRADNLDEEKQKVFLVDNRKTIEVRTDEKLGKFLAEKYETVMRSRYFGRGGIEIVPVGQLKETEILDLIRLSYNLSASEN